MFDNNFKTFIRIFVIEVFFSGREVYDAYFSGLEPIVKTVFEIIHYRIDPLFHLKAPMTSSELSNWDGEQNVEKREDFVKWNSLFINNMRLTLVVFSVVAVCEAKNARLAVTRF